MAPHLVSWSGNEPIVSPVLPSRASIVSVDSILPDTRGSSLSTTGAKAKAIPDAVADVNAAAEKEKQESNAHATRVRADAAAARARKKEERRLEKEWEMAELRAKQVEEQAANLRAMATIRAARTSSAEEQIAKQRAADKAAREAARLSSTNAIAAPRWGAAGSGSGWLFNKLTQPAEVAATPPLKDESNPSSKSITSYGSDTSAEPPGKSTYPSSEVGPLGNVGGSSQRPPIANSASRDPVSSLPTTSTRKIAWATINMSPASLLSQELEPGKESQEAPRAFEYQAGSSINSLVTETGEGRPPANAYLGADDSLLRHDKYFFNDGNITFLVDGTLYCIHRYFFSRDSEYFSTRFAQLGIRDHEALPTIISLGDIERREFEAFLSVIYPKDFEKHDLCYEEWVSVLHLSTRWGFASLRKLALASINPPTPHDQLLLARRYSIEDWVLPALSSLCERTAPLSLDEARQMKIEDVVTVATVRENIRHCTLRVDVAEIPRRVEATLAGKLSSYEGVDVPPAKPEPPPMGGDAAPSTRTGTPCFGGIGIPSTEPATPMSSGFPIPSTTTVTPCFAGVSTPPTVPETPGFVFSPRPMTPSFVVVTKPSDVVTPPSRPVTPKLDNVAIPSPGPATFMFGGAAPSATTGTPCFGGVAVPSPRPATSMFGVPVSATGTGTPCSPTTGAAVPPTRAWTCGGLVTGVANEPADGGDVKKKKGKGKKGR